MSQKGKPRINPSSVKKILLIRLRRIGDIIMTTPAVTVLKQSFPDSLISYVVEESYLQLVERNPSLDKIIVVERNQKAQKFFKLIRQIRGENYDVVIDFHGGPRASLLTLLSKAKLKIGYKIKYKGLIYDYRVPRSPRDGNIHSVENHINLVKVLGANVHSFPSLFLPKAPKPEVDKIKKFIKENRLEDSKIITLHISAGNDFRDWGADYIIDLAQFLLQDPGRKIILIGTNEDRAAEQKILKESLHPLLSLVGELNLSELRELISQSSLFVGPDSGPMHVAASTSTPIIAYFGPTLPENFSPWKSEAFVIEKKFDCRPCKQRKCIFEDFRCLRSIKPEEVYKACLRYV